MFPSFLNKEKNNPHFFFFCESSWPAREKNVSLLYFFFRESEESDRTKHFIDPWQVESSGATHGDCIYSHVVINLNLHSSIDIGKNSFFSMFVNLRKVYFQTYRTRRVEFTVRVPRDSTRIDQIIYSAAPVRITLTTKKEFLQS